MAWEKETSSPTENQNTRTQLNLYVEICTVQCLVSCVKNKITYKRARKICMWLFFSAAAKGKWPTRSHKCNLDPSCLFASEVTASKLQVFSLHVQKWSATCYPSNLGCTSTTSVPGPAVQWPEQHLLEEDRFSLKPSYVKHPEMQASKGHLWPKNLLSAETRRKVFPIWGLARRYESLAAVKSSLFKIPAKSNSFHAVTNHWSLFPLQADSYSLQLSSDCALLVPADSNYLSSSSLSSFHGEPEKQMTKGPRWGSNLILSSWDEKTMQRLQGKDRKIYVFKKKNGGGKREIEGPGGQSHQCEGRNVQKVHV